MNKQSGFSLIELLVALGLSVFILSSAYFLYATQHRAYEMQQSLIHLKNNAQVAVHLLRDRLQQAGGLGCTSWHSQLAVYNKANSLAEWIPMHSSDILQLFYASSVAWDPPLPSYLQNRVKPETDVMVVHQAYQESANLIQTMANKEVPLLLPKHLNIKVGDALIIADCDQADIFQISDLSQYNNQWMVSHQPPYNRSSALSKTYNKEAYVSVLQSVAYYIGDTDRKYANGNPIYALYQFTSQHNAAQHNEVIEGMSNLSIESFSFSDISFSLESQTAFLSETWNVITHLRQFL